MQYRYTALRMDNKIIEGEMDALNPDEVLDYLASTSLRPLSIKPARIFSKGSIRIFGNSITVADQVFLTKYLALMLRVNTDLYNALDILIADFEKPAMKSLLLEVRSNLSKGKPFYLTFQNYPKEFSSVFINMIKAGEKSGNLETVFQDLSVILERQQDLRSRIRAALIYPIILVIASMMILILLVSFALPRIASIFTQQGTESNLPFFSRVVFAVGLFIGAHIFIIFGTIIFCVVAFFILYLKSVKFRRLLFKVFSRLPVVHTVILKIAIQRFASTLSNLLKSGLPVLDAIETTADAVGNQAISESLYRISRERIAKGLTVGEAFKRETIFPRTVSNLIAISEKSGHIQEILETLANFYEHEVDASLKTLVSLLEPILLFGIGIIIGLIAVSIIIPIYQLTTSFS